MRKSFDAFLVAGVVIASCGCVTEQRGPVYGAAELPHQPSMPDPLVMLDGRPVASSVEWSRQRGPELKRLFQEYMYGTIPPKPARMNFRRVGEYGDFLGGAAKLKFVTIETGPG